jgi:hypothetical protein
MVVDAITLWILTTCTIGVKVIIVCGHTTHVVKVSVTVCQVVFTAEKVRPVLTVILTMLAQPNKTGYTPMRYFVGCLTNINAIIIIISPKYLDCPRILS